ncbi:MAG: hypothetical protein JW951_03320 [Lentisphaerae bacterium]|nr:hypothetical protein [Lentisphaerota bacterium]
MTNRERFLKTLRFETVDHPPLSGAGNPWPYTRTLWEQQGLPTGVDLPEYFGLEPTPRRHVGIDTLLWPPFEEVVLESADEYIVKIDKHGVKVRNFKDEASMPEHLAYPVKGPESLGWLREKLDWNTPGRIDPGWQAGAERDRAAGNLVFANGGMYFAFLNEHMGTAALMTAYFDHPEFIHAVNDLLCTLCEQTLRTVLPEFTLDMMGYHEDMAYKTASLISPSMFKEFMTPYYRRVTALTGPAGIDVHVMDSDGNIRELIPLWLECGINVMTPCEVAAGMDVAALRREYGGTLGMIGGFDKRILASSKPAIKAELERLRPVIEGGGYIPMCDHGVPPDVPFEHYAYLVELLKSLYGM